MNTRFETLPAIVRYANGHQLYAWHWHSLPQLKLELGWDDAARDCLFADLSMGAWRGHWLAHEFAAQLDLSAPQPIQPMLYPDAEMASHYADIVGRLVDNESEGDRNFMVAYAFARQLVAAMQAQQRRWLLVVAPVADQLWGAENVLLLKMLCDAAPVYGFELGLLLRSDANLPELPNIDIVLCNRAGSSVFETTDTQEQLAIPGLLQQSWLLPEIREKVEFLQLNDGSLLLSPNCRPLHVPTQNPTVMLPPYLQVCFALQQEQQDVGFLQQQAGARFAEGAYEIAYLILDGIRRSQLSPMQAALVSAQKQNISIALMDFKRAADEELPSAALPNLVQASLYQSKAWGLVMTGQAAIAETLFAKARTLLDPQQYQRLYLYLLNISALNKLRLGQIEQALAFEKDIEQQLQQLEQADWHLIYINCLNQARIYKKLRDFEQAGQYYRRGFFVNYQLRNESDLLYANLCLAQLESMQGDHRAAFPHWLRAALHWLANPTPEALAPRVAQAVLGRPLSNKEADVEQISFCLQTQLQLTCSALKIDLTSAARNIPMHRIHTPRQAQQCIGLPGWSVMLSQQSFLPLPFDGPQYLSFNRWVIGLLHALVPQADILHAQVIFTDHQCGIELPANPREMLWSCLKWEIPSMWFDGRDYQVPLTQENPQLATSFMVENSRAINYVHADQGTWQVHFKRYLQSLQLKPIEQACLGHLQQARSLEELSQFLQSDMLSCMQLVNQLAEKRLLSIM